MQSKPKLVTTPDSPDHKFSSGYGHVTYREWCEREVERMNSKADNVYVYEHCGQIALVRGKKAK